MPEVFFVLQNFELSRKFQEHLIDYTKSEVPYWLKDASPRNKALLPAGEGVGGEWSGRGAGEISGGNVEI